MPNVEDFKLAQVVRLHSDGALGRLTQIQSIASKHPRRAGHRAIARVCETTRHQLTKEWLSLLSVGVTLKPHVRFEMGSVLRDHETPPVFLSIEAFQSAPVEPIIAVNDKEKLIAWHSDWVRANTGIILGFGLPVIALVAHAALRERTQIEEMTPSRIVFLSRGQGDDHSRHGWARITIDLGVVQEDAAYLDATRHPETPHVAS